MVRGFDGFGTGCALSGPSLPSWDHHRRGSWVADVGSGWTIPCRRVKWPSSTFEWLDAFGAEQYQCQKDVPQNLPLMENL